MIALSPQLIERRLIGRLRNGDAAAFEELVRSSVPLPPTSFVPGLASLGVTFDERYLDEPGFLYFVLQQLYFQNINIVELASTSTELILYLAQADVRLAFDTIYQRFVHKEA